jgi:hypothetical protein
MTYTEAETKIKELLDKEFLDKLLEIGKLYGWSGDYVEIGSFIEELHRLGGIDNVDTEPYQLHGD